MRLSQIRTISGYFSLINSPHYVAAHAGDLAAALRLVQSLITDWSFCSHMYGYVCPVHKGRGNMIPYALALLISQHSRLQLVSAVHLTTSRPGTRMIQRMSWTPAFIGTVPAGNYLIVDDVFTSGITLKGLKSYIESAGSSVFAAITLACSKHGKDFEPDKVKLESLLSKFPAVAGIVRVPSLTTAQVDYILRFSSLNTFLAMLSSPG